MPTTLRDWRHIVAFISLVSSFLTVILYLVSGESW